MIELYDCELSSDAYKARLLLSILGVSWKTHYVEYYPRREHRSAWFLEINPRGELPVINDAGTIVEDAQAVLVHIARQYDRSGFWYPHGSTDQIGQVSMWLSFADALTETACAARLHDSLLHHHIDVEMARRGAHEMCAILDEHLWFGEQEAYGWLCGLEHPTIADIACFPDVMLAEEGGIMLHEYPAIRRWTDRVKAIPGFVTMAGIFGA